eukprot:6463712-Amphidinium_carterae.2
MVVKGPLVPIPPNIIDAPSRVLCIPYASYGCAPGNTLTRELKLGPPALGTTPAQLTHMVVGGALRLERELMDRVWHSHSWA